MCKETVKKFQNLQGLVCKPLNRDWVARVVFPVKKRTSYLIVICSYRSFQQHFLKANCFRVYRKLITWPTILQKAYLVLFSQEPQRGRGCYHFFAGIYFLGLQLTWKKFSWNYWTFPSKVDGESQLFSTNSWELCSPYGRVGCLLVRTITTRCACKDNRM